MTKGKELRKINKNSLAWDLVQNRSLYLLMIPVVLYYLLFHYLPMYGAIMAFQDYSPMRGLFGSDFIGFDNFLAFFDSYYFWRIFGNTLIISFLSLAFEFTTPIILALLINELRSRTLSGFVKSISVFPHFISLVIVCGMVKDFTSMNGIINQLMMGLGYDGLSMLQKPELFRPIYILSGIWQNVGWDSIIYIAALMAIDQTLYEAADIDGAGQWKKLLKITIPCILPTIVVMFILRVGNIMNVGFEKIILLYNPINYETSDVISSFVYRKGLIDFQWSYAAAVGLFNSVINLVLLLAANKMSKKVTQSSLW